MALEYVPADIPGLGVTMTVPSKFELRTIYRRWDTALQRLTAGLVGLLVQTCLVTLICWPAFGLHAISSIFFYYGRFAGSLQV